jgi:rhodanese-related sulfurtransferase
VTEVDVDPAALVNVNTPDDLAAVQYARSVAIREITVDELAALGDGVSLVDVRETHEWDDGHISYAELVPLATVPDHVDSFRGSPTYVICRSGGRSAKACEFLLAQGVDVVNVAGGMLAWEARGLPVEAGADGSVGG